MLPVSFSALIYLLYKLSIFRKNTFFMVPDIYPYFVLLSFNSYRCKSSSSIKLTPTVPVSVYINTQPLVIESDSHFTPSMPLTVYWTIRHLDSVNKQIFGNLATLISSTWFKSGYEPSRNPIKRKRSIWNGRIANAFRYIPVVWEKSYWRTGSSFSIPQRYRTLLSNSCSILFS